MTGWYALQTRSCCEQQVASSFERHEAFYPFSLRKGWRDRQVRAPYFPGYVFCRADLADLGTRHSFVASPWVIRLVGRGSEPEAIPDLQVNSVRNVAQLARELAAKVEVIPTASFHPGQLIQIHYGPLKGIQGYVTYLKDKIRLVVQVEMLGQAVSAEVDARWLHGLKAT